MSIPTNLRCTELRYNNTIIPVGVNLGSDTVSEEFLAAGKTAHNASGVPITGTAALVYNSSTEELTLPSWVVTIT